MLFNSQIFLLCFLPLALLAFYALKDTRLRLWMLLFASLAFYGYHHPPYLGVMLGSVLMNWALARLYARSGRGWLIPCGIALNLALLFVYKYADFTLSSLQIFGLALQAKPFDLLLPLGISFFTFEQISYLVELKRRNATAYPFRDHALYIAFFPHLMAGPIMRHYELIPQFSRPLPGKERYETLCKGFALLTLGLTKKVLLADKFAELANPVFASAAGQTPGMFDAWAAMLAFTLQIYFDFSGYTDMAIGMALMMGFTLPENFNAPYRAASIADFWRRWHITLSRFLRDYLYIPLGGNRRGLSVQCAALLFTMLLGGLWHGAAWTFVLWGLLHGAALAAHAIWRKAGGALPGWLGWMATFLFVTVTWVPFRAESWEACLRVWEGILGLGGASSLSFKEAVMIAPGLALVWLAPSAGNLARRVTPHRGLLFALAAFFVVIALELGKGQANDFIYFQF